MRGQFGAEERDEKDNVARVVIYAVVSKVVIMIGLLDSMDYHLWKD